MSSLGLGINITEPFCHDPILYVTENPSGRMLFMDLWQARRIRLTPAPNLPGSYMERTQANTTLESSR